RTDEAGDRERRADAGQAPAAGRRDRVLGRGWVEHAVALRVRRPGPAGGAGGGGGGRGLGARTAGRVPGREPAAAGHVPDRGLALAGGHVEPAGGAGRGGGFPEPVRASGGPGGERAPRAGGLAALG